MSFGKNGVALREIKTYLFQLLKQDLWKMFLNVRWWKLKSVALLGVCNSKCHYQIKSLEKNTKMVKVSSHFESYCSSLCRLCSILLPLPDKFRFNLNSTHSLFLKNYNRPVRQATPTLQNDNFKKPTTPYRLQWS